MNLTWRFIAGIGFFLYGLLLMDQALTKLSGRSFKQFLRRNTNTVWKAIAGGTVITGLLQSSSVIGLITLGFVEAGMIPFKNALGVMMGSNLGSTIISWVIATIGFKLNIEDLALPGLAISTICMFFLKPRKKLFNSFRLLFAIALIFYGLGFMKQAAGVFVEQVDISAYKNQPLIIFVLIGLIITSIVQTSSATVAIALTALYSNVIGFPAAASIVIGSEVGTSLKTLVAGVNGTGEKKRAAFGNFYFNVITVVLAFSFLPFIIRFIREIIGITDPLIGLAFFQSLINVIAILVMLPFLDRYAKWLEKQFQKTDTEESFVSPGFHQLTDPDPEALKEEIINLLEKDLEFHDVVIDLDEQGQEGFFQNVKAFTRKSGYTEQMYNRLKVSAGELLEFQIRWRDEHLNQQENKITDIYMEALRQVMHSAKSIKDIHHNITDLRETADDQLHSYYLSIQDDWTAFKKAFQQTKNNPDQLTLLMHQVHADLENHNNKIHDHLKKQTLDEADVSTLLNIEREILSSKKALIRAVESLHQ